MRLLFLLILATPILSPQDIAGSLRGSLLDASGAVVADAKVTAVNEETSLNRSTTSDSKGNYLLVALPVGHYRLEAEAAGFKKYIQEGITLDVNQAATVSIELTVGTTTQEIEVKANAAIIETTSTNLGQAVGDREILDLPLNGRHFTQLGLLQPGVVPITPGLIEAGGTTRGAILCGERPAPGIK